MATRIQLVLQIDDRETWAAGVILQAFRAATYTYHFGEGPTGRMLRMMNYTYLLKCADGTLYCGWTNHLEERIRAHNEGRGAKYTKGRRPVELVYHEVFETRQDAMRREVAIKKLRREEKWKLIRKNVVK